jgi:hypothetical protein
MKEASVKQLIGEWISDPSDSESVRKYGRVSLRFKDNGQLIYRIHSQGETNIMLLTYRVQDDILFTNQPSAPREEKTIFFITPEGKLTLIYGNDPCRFVKAPVSELSEP